MSEKFDDAEEEYKKNPELSRDDVAKVKEWCAKQPHLPKLNEFEVILFLHSCFYKIEATKVCIETFYTVRAHCPDFFSNRNPVINKSEVLDLVLYCPLPKQTSEGYTIIFCKLFSGNVENYSFASQVKVYDMAAMLMLHQHGTSKGYIFVTEMEDVTLGHLTRISPSHVKKFLFYLQNAMPVRIKSIHFLNIPSFMDKILALVKPFVKNELLSVFYLHDNMEKFYGHVRKEYMPRDYGGKAPSVAELAAVQRKNFLDNVKYFEEEELKIADDAKRSRVPKNETICGLQGNFKQLDID